MHLEFDGFPPPLFAEANPSRSKLGENAFRNFEQYCFDCHNGETKKGGLDLTQVLEREGSDGSLVFENLITAKMPPAFFGNPTRRGPMVNQAGNGVKTLRDGPWKIIFGQGPDRVRPAAGKGMLFNLKIDPFETTDLWDRHPERVKAMHALLAKIQGDG